MQRPLAAVLPALAVAAGSPSSLGGSHVLVVAPFVLAVDLSFGIPRLAPPPATSAASTSSSR